MAVVAAFYNPHPSLHGLGPCPSQTPVNLHTTPPIPTHAQKTLRADHILVSLPVPT